MSSVIFDLEGPLSPMDHAYEVMRRFVPEGDLIFEVLSRYDDVVYLKERREGYEPGTTLQLIVPFLLAHGVTEEGLKEVSEQADLTPGALETVRELTCPKFIASTSYEQHALTVASRLGIPERNVYCTRLPLDEAPEPSEEERELVREIERELLELYPPDEVEDRELVDRVDELLGRLEGTSLGEFSARVKVVGGSRKAAVVEDVCESLGLEVEEVACIGDSITDVEMLRAVREGGGLAVAFNGNEYCIPEADVAVAAPSLIAILPILETFFEHGKEEALEVAFELEGREVNPGVEAEILVVEEATEEELEEFIERSERMRERVRGEAGKLG
ncbi:HAD hydrolase family protein [Methanopyrus sp.]